MKITFESMIVEGNTKYMVTYSESHTGDYGYGGMMFFPREIPKETFDKALQLFRES